MLGLIAVSVLTVVVSALCSLFEATLLSTRAGAIEAEKSGGRHPELAARMLRMKQDIAKPTSAILILNTVANTAGATIFGLFAALALGTRWVPWISIALVVAILFVGEILPKTYGATHWRSLWPWIVRPLLVLQVALSPAIHITRAFARLFAGSGRSPAVTEDEIQATIQMGSKTGELSDSEVQLLTAVFRFDDMLTRQVMVPRMEVVFLDVNWPASQAFEVAERTRHTRFPLCEGSLDSVKGLVHIKDLLGQPADGDMDLESVARPLRHVPETLPISRLMHQMQKDHQHMALVDDEHGSVVGIVTMENVVEQIVGEVQDEFDSEPPEVTEDRPGIFKVNGHLPLERVNREVGVNLQSQDVDTLSGLLVSHLNRFVEAGDQVKIQGAILRVLKVEGGRATWVRITVPSRERGVSRAGADRA